MKPEVLYAFIHQKLDRMDMRIHVKGDDGDLIATKLLSGMPNIARTFMSAMGDKPEVKQGLVGGVIVCEDAPHISPASYSMTKRHGFHRYTPDQALRQFMQAARWIFNDALDRGEITDDNDELYPDWAAFSYWYDKIDENFGPFASTEKVVAMVDLMQAIHGQIYLVLEGEGYGPMEASLDRQFEDAMRQHRNGTVTPDTVLHVLLLLYSQYRNLLGPSTAKHAKEMLEMYGKDLFSAELENILYHLNEEIQMIIAKPVPFTEDDHVFVGVESFCNSCEVLHHNLETYENSPIDVYSWLRHKYVENGVLNGVDISKVLRKHLDDFILHYGDHDAIQRSES